MKWLRRLFCGHLATTTEHFAGLHWWSCDRCGANRLRVDRRLRDGNEVQFGQPGTWWLREWPIATEDWPS